MLNNQNGSEVIDFKELGITLIAPQEQYNRKKYDRGAQLGSVINGLYHTIEDRQSLPAHTLANFKQHAN